MAKAIELNLAQRALRRKARGRVQQTTASNHVYKLIELTGTSTISVEDAVHTAIARAGATVKNLRWFQITETRGDIADNKVAHWQVTLKVGFTVEG